MHASINENQLIIVDIVDAMADYVSIQIDIDETRVKAAEIVAQNVDIKRLIGKDNVDRCIGQTDASSDADKELKALLIAPICYYTYARCLRMFQGNFSDSGYTIEGEAEDRNAAKSASNEMSSIADTFMDDVLTFLEAEGTDEDVDRTKVSPQVSVFGGEENRASN